MGRKWVINLLLFHDMDGEFQGEEEEKEEEVS